MTLKYQVIRIQLL